MAWQSALQEGHFLNLKEIVFYGGLEQHTCSNIQLVLAPLKPRNLPNIAKETFYFIRVIKSFLLPGFRWKGLWFTGWFLLLCPTLRSQIHLSVKFTWLKQLQLFFEITGLFRGQKDTHLYIFPLQTIHIIHSLGALISRKWLA